MILRTTISVAILFSAAVSAADVLSPLHIDKKSITISGVSSGAFMAVQMGVAYSSIIKGVASVAGGPYHCARGDSSRAQSACMNQPDQVDTSVLVSDAVEAEARGSIDPLGNLSQQSIYVYASPKDAIINPKLSDKLVDFYASLRPSAGIHLENSVPSAHGFPTLDQGNPCGLGFLPWLLKCGFDTAGEIAKFFYDPFAARGVADGSHLHKFDQAEFDPNHFLFGNGWVYVPSDCARGGCRLHVALHGCQMNPDFVQDQFARLSGFNEWAEANRIVVLYPQSAKFPGKNPYGCWDWFGYSGSDYATKSGPQMRSLYAMIVRLAQ